MAADSAPRRPGGSFLAGAGGRLLPASVPFAWFGIAVAFHGGAWVALGMSSTVWRHWHGGLGWPLAALHALTLGTLVASAVGASLQLLPVATRQPVRWPRAGLVLALAYVPGLAALLAGMGWQQPRWLAAGAAVVIAVLAGWGALLAANLRGARGMPGVVLHGRGALAALALLASSAAALAALWTGHAWLPRDAARALHLAAGVWGVMGLLVLGLAAILLPMFALGDVPAERVQLTGGWAALAALVLAGGAALGPEATGLALALRAAALGAAALALGLHVRAMQRVLAGGLRGDLGRCGRLIRLGWCSAALALALGAARLVAGATGHEAAAGTLGALFVLAAVGGWLTSFLFGVLQRILPFLASMHAARGRRRAPTPSALTLEAALAWHERGHVAALALLVAAVLDRSGPWLLAAAFAGGAGALAFAVFFVALLVRLRRSRAEASGSPRAEAAGDPGRGRS